MKLEEKIQLVLNKDSPGVSDSSLISSYDGFNMHEDSENVREDNLLLLSRFEDFFKTDIREIAKHLNFWKGCGEFKYKDFFVEFGGWSSANIIAWLIENADDVFEAQRLREKEPTIKRRILVMPPRVITPQQRYEVLKRQNWKCNFCHTSLKYSKRNSWEAEVAHIDHIHPYSDAINYKNGIMNINETNNLQALCPKCNLTKGKKGVN